MSISLSAVTPRSLANKPRLIGHPFNGNQHASAKSFAFSNSINLRSRSLLVSSKSTRKDGDVKVKEKTLAPSSDNRLSIKDALIRTWDLVFNSGVLPELLVAYAYKDLFTFIINRISHFLTNTVAAQLLGVEVFNPWWIFMDPNFLQATPGYVFIVAFFFIATLPLITLMDSAAFATAAAILRRRPKTPALSHKEEATTASASAASSSSTSNPTPAAATDPSSMGNANGNVAPSDTESSYVASSASQGDTTTSSAVSSSLPSVSTFSESPSVATPAPEVVGGEVEEAAKKPRENEKRAREAERRRKEDEKKKRKTEEREKERKKKEKKGKEDLKNQSLAASPSPPTPKPSATEAFIRRLWEAHKAVTVAFREEALAITRPLWRADLALMWHALPYQAAALLVLPVPWALPRLFEIQLTGAVVVEELKKGGKSEEFLSKKDESEISAAKKTGAAKQEGPWAFGSRRSREILSGSAWRYAVPFFLLRGALHLSDYLHGQLLALVPKRWWSEVVEIPLFVTLLLMILRSLSGRMLNVLPLATYQLRVSAKAVEGTDKGDDEVRKAN